MVMAIDGSTQSAYPAAMTTAGNAKDATNWTMVATVTARPMRFASGPLGMGAVPAVTRRP